MSLLGAYLLVYTHLQTLLTILRTVFGWTRIVAAFRAFWPPKRARSSEAFHEIPLSGQAAAPISKVVHSGCSREHLNKVTTDGGSRAAIVGL
jgi:hypothetical protein